MPELPDLSALLSQVLAPFSLVVYTADVTADFTILSMGGDVAGLTGCAAEDFISYPSFWAERVHPEDAPVIRSEFSKLPRLGCHRMVYRWRTADGSYRWLSDSRCLVKQPDGQASCLLGLWQDVTEFKFAEQALRESEDRYRALVENQGEGVASVDASERFTFANRAAEEIFGVGPGGLAGRTVMEFVNDENAALVREQTKWRRAGKKSTYELEIVRPDGATRILLLTATPQYNPDGAFNLSFGIFRDITELRRAETALRASEAKYRGLFEHVPIGVYQSTPAGKILTANPALVKLLGYGSPADLLDADIGDDLYFDPQQRLTLTEKLELEGQLRNEELVLRRKDGSRITVLENCRAVKDQAGEGPYYEGTLIDITHHKELEERYQQAQKLESIGRLAGGIAHDFNNLLTIINGYSELLLDELPEGSPLRAPAEEVRKAGQRAADLTQQLLSFSRKQVVYGEVLDLNQEVVETGQMLQRLIGADIELVVNLDPSIARIEMGPGQIQQVLMNLAVNARDAMPRGGRLTIATRDALIEDEEIERSVGLPPGRYVKLTVSDSGVGMDEETRKHIFEPFYTTKEVGKGTGLGLATVYGIVTQSGGDIRVDSEEHNGTVVTIHLPAVSDFHIQPWKQEQPAGLPKRAATILVVEDEPGVRNLVVNILRSRDYEVLAARDGQQALEICQAYPEPIHLTLSDVVMPAMSGPELAKNLKALRPEMPVLFMSGYAQSSVLAESTVAAAFLRKPFTAEALLRSVHQILDSSSSPETGHANVK